MDVTKLNTLEEAFKDTNAIRDANIAILSALSTTIDTVKDKVFIIKTINDLLKSKEDNILNIVKTTLLNADVSSNVDYKQAAIEMLKTVTPASISKGHVVMDVNTDLELEKRFEDSGTSINTHELSLED